MRYFLPLLLLSGCNTISHEAVVCRTRCGVQVLNWPTPQGKWSCDEIQFQEDEFLEESTKANDERFRDSCSAMFGWQVFMRDEESFTDKEYAKGEVGLDGLTFCTDGESYISNRAPWESAYAHEMAHVVQNCSPNGCAHTRADSHHWCWDTNGIYDFLNAVEQDTKPENRH